MPDGVLGVENFTFVDVSGIEKILCHGYRIIYTAGLNEEKAGIALANESYTAESGRRNIQVSKLEEAGNVLFGPFLDDQETSGVVGDVYEHRRTLRNIGIRDGVKVRVL